MKTKTTKDLEKLLANHFNDRNDFYVFECTIGWVGNEIVDCIMYNCQREIYCYEIKQSKQDFHSKNALTFIGNKNYFVMPYDLYQEVKLEIPQNIGVYVAIDRLEMKETEKINEYGIKTTSYKKTIINGMKKLYCIKNAQRQELKADKEVILSSMLRSMQRDRILDISSKVVLKSEINNRLIELKRQKEINDNILFETKSEDAEKENNKIVARMKELKQLL